MRRDREYGKGRAAREAAMARANALSRLVAHPSPGEARIFDATER